MPAREDWVLSYDIQEAIQRVAVLTWSISNHRTLEQRFADGLAAIDDVRVEMMDKKDVWLKIGEAFELVENDKLADQILDQREEKISAELKATEDLLKQEEIEVEQVKKLITQQLGDKVQLNMS